MGCVYLFVFWSLLPLVYPPSETLVLYVSSGILQLALLPLILVGQALLGKNQEKRAISDHRSIMTIVQDVHKMVKSIKEQEDNMIIILAKLDYIEKQLSK